MARRKNQNPLTDPMWIIGCIDSHGAIHARVSKSGQSIMHGPQESKGKRWRWNIWAQDWVASIGGFELANEEFQIVSDWLIKKGYKDE